MCSPPDSQPLSPARTTEQPVVVFTGQSSTGQHLVAGSQQQAVFVSNCGAGRILGEFYTAGGRLMAMGAGHLAHRLGYGPDAVAKGIWERFENQAERLNQLAALRQGNTVDRKLEAKCVELMSYALP